MQGPPFGILFPFRNVLLKIMYRCFVYMPFRFTHMVIRSIFHVPWSFSVDTMFLRSVRVCVHQIPASNCWWYPLYNYGICFIHLPEVSTQAVSSPRRHRQPLAGLHMCSCGPCGKFLVEHAQEGNFWVLGYACLSCGCIVPGQAPEGNTPRYPTTLHVPANTWYLPALLVSQCNRCEIVSHFVNLH